MPRRRKTVEEELDELTREIQAEIERIEKEVTEKFSSPEFMKKIEEYIQRHLTSAGIHRVLLLDFVLPSVDLKSRSIKLELGRKVLRERGLSTKDLKRISSLRTRFFQILRKHGAFKLGSKAWAILPGFEKELVKEAGEKLKELNEIIKEYGFPPRTLDVIEMYAPTSWIINRIAETVNEYKMDLEETLEKIRQAEITREEVRSAKSKVSKLRKIIARLEEELSTLLASEQERAQKYIVEEAERKAAEEKAEETAMKEKAEMEPIEYTPIRLSRASAVFYVPAKFKKDNTHINVGDEYIGYIVSEFKADSFENKLKFTLKEVRFKVVKKFEDGGVLLSPEGETGKELRIEIPFIELEWTTPRRFAAEHKMSPNFVINAKRDTIVGRYDESKLDKLQRAIIDFVRYLKTYYVDDEIGFIPDLYVRRPTEPIGKVPEELARPAPEVDVELELEIPEERSRKYISL